MSKTPVELVVGDGEAADNSVTVRRYGSKDAVKMGLDEFLNSMMQEIDAKTINRGMEEK